MSVAIQEQDGKALAWVVERGPVRRVSVWDVATGKLERDCVGGTGYQGSDGMMSDDLPSWGYAMGAVYEVDLKNHRYAVKELMGLPEPPTGSGKYDLFRFGVNQAFRVPVHFVSNASGKPVEYFCDGGHIAQCVFIKRNGYWSCSAALGNARIIGDLRWPKDFPKPPSPDVIFVFTATNGDGYASADEVAPKPMSSNEAPAGEADQPAREAVFPDSSPFSLVRAVGHSPSRFASASSPSAI